LLPSPHLFCFFWGELYAHELVVVKTTREKFKKHANKGEVQKMEGGNRLSPSAVGLPQRLLHQPVHIVEELDWLPATPQHSPMPTASQHNLHEPQGAPDIPTLLVLGHSLGRTALLPWLLLLWLTKFIPHPWAGKQRLGVTRIVLLLLLAPVLIPALCITAFWWPVIMLDYFHYRASTGEPAVLSFSGFTSKADADVGKAEIHGECGHDRTHVFTCAN
jgi:hypothetical protein